MNSDFSLCGAFFCDNAQVVALFAIDGHCLTCGPKWGIDRKDKMLFLLTVLNVAYVLDSNLQPLEDPAPNATPEEIAKVAELKKKREEDKFTCCGHILNTLSDRLFRDLKVIIPKSLQVEAIISKLPSSWNDYRKKLLHMIEDFTVEKILRHLRIEEETRKRDVVYLPQGSKVNHDTEPRKSQSVRKEKDFGLDFISSQSLAYLVEGDRESVIRKIHIMLNVEGDPQTYGEAMASRDAAFRKEAINNEMDSILFNNTWVLVDLPQGSKPIGCKWVFKRKNNPTGVSPTFKARLVAKGFRQNKCLDYFDTYAPVAMMTSIQVLMALASIHKLHVHQMDVKTAFFEW
ncbi:hypothetical protein CRG98_029150 [Punica granatum]|uniref:Reverse transcriptase Ty1/copia-type domain-containing protein n=1 Tax=Punica granatum TaxID=22663 RepID=A0A2I0J2K4_PUNGR|nr:hypothetical protein CRG98_029150 [Punica granatum]